MGGTAAEAFKFLTFFLINEREKCVHAPTASRVTLTRVLTSPKGLLAYKSARLVKKVFKRTVLDATQSRFFFRDSQPSWPRNSADVHGTIGSILCFLAPKSNKVVVYQAEGPEFEIPLRQLNTSVLRPAHGRHNVQHVHGILEYR